MDVCRWMWKAGWPRIGGIGLLLLAFLPTRALAGSPPRCEEVERFSLEPCIGRKPLPKAVEDFLARPTRSQWEAQLALGWGGSDGSTAARDVIAGVRVGATSRRLEDVDLPANRHDWYYELGRSYGLGERFRRAADQAYREMCLQRLRGVRGLRGALARTNVNLRYLALRLFGLGAWKAHPGAAVPEDRDTAHIASNGRPSPGRRADGAQWTFLSSPSQ